MIAGDSRTAAVVLAAGQGTRMKSKLQKVLHPVAGVPMVEHVLAAVGESGVPRALLVVGREAEQVRRALGARVEYVEQARQLGTGHAVAQARPVLAGQVDTVLVLYGDTPLLRGATLRSLLDLQAGRAPAVTMLTATAADPAGYGRILRDERGRVAGIMEEAVASPEQRQVREINSGVYCFRASWLWPHLERVQLSPKGEYYLTDLIAMAVGEGEEVETVTLAEASEAMGINDRVALAEAERVARSRVRERLMRAGVTFVDPGSCLVDATVAIGQDTVIWPNCLLRGSTRIGADCQIGPGAVIEDSSVGDRSRVVASFLESARVEDDVTLGPFCHLRPGAHLAGGVELGNFAEVKQSYLGPGTKMHHFSYLGDATVGAGVNVGAGTITCNYDSETRTKSRTVVEDEVGLGSDTMLVAPVRIGARSTTGAGSVVTRDLPPDSVAYGVPAVVKRARRPLVEKKT
ncbi:MAG: bifunctional UDP-N-acetylglucosamine diphosphorylase/glucosamine-1-phosphate N-acetyltransferase GlmU [Chloroflexi bacterium]|nr:bifunctional UDP-N-acetylglucosamine diphosphorylase/glucosamine-1-phosphate N-acetyltransferase GlmU [Chloroflexota bacterium]